MAGVPVSVMSAVWKGIIAAGVKHVGAVEHNAIIAALSPCFTPNYLDGINGWPLSPIGDTGAGEFDPDVIVQELNEITFEACKRTFHEPAYTAEEQRAIGAYVKEAADNGWVVEPNEETHTWRATKAPETRAG